MRPADWQFGVSVQQEPLPRVSAEVGYNRRSFHNFFLVDNQLVGPVDYDPWVYTAPCDSRLPGGGGYEIVQWAITREAALRGAQNHQTFEIDFGKAPTEYWHGVDVSVNARLRNGLTFQGGTSSGRGVRDHCATVVNIDSPDPQGCRVVESVLTSFRGLASYTVPFVDVLVSAQVRSVNPANVNGGGAQAATSGSSLDATTQVPNTVVQQSLGRLPGFASALSNTAVNLLTDGQLYPDQRVNQVDMRFAKILRFAGYRADVGVDLYNLFNSNHTTAFDQGYDHGVGDGGAWLQPTSIVNPPLQCDVHVLAPTIPGGGDLRLAPPGPDSSRPVARSSVMVAPSVNRQQPTLTRPPRPPRIRTAMTGRRSFQNDGGGRVASPATGPPSRAAAVSSPFSPLHPSLPT